MKRPDRIVRAPGGSQTPLVSVTRAEDVGAAIRPGVTVEVDPEAAKACGAWADPDVDAAEAFEAAADPAAFGDGGQGGGDGA